MPLWEDETVKQRSRGNTADLEDTVGCQGKNVRLRRTCPQGHSMLESLAAPS